MIIDTALGKQQRRPFDWCITEKQALILALRTRGRSFQHDAQSSFIYEMPVERRQGVVSNGIYFWHDYPKADRLTISPDWRDSIPRVNEKYAFLWRRFIDELQEPGEKTFVVATTQHNLAEYADNPEDFRRKFALDDIFIAELVEELTAICGERFSVLALAGSHGEAEALRGPAGFERLTVRFCGSLPLSEHRDLADFVARGGRS